MNIPGFACAGFLYNGVACSLAKGRLDRLVVHGELFPKREARMISRRQFVTQLGTGASLALGMPAVWAAPPSSELARRKSGTLTSNHAVATVHPLATQAAAELLSDGGNAIDAAIAAALVLGVVDGHNSGIGGGCLVLIRLADGRLRAIDGRETAGAAATPHIFTRDGKPDPRLSQTGPLACGVPGQIAAMDRMHRAHGCLPWQRLFDRAIEIARDGHPASRSTARTLAREVEDLNRFPASRGILLHSNGEPLAEGELLVQRELAQTLRNIAANGCDWFYSGEFAKNACAYLSSLGGILTESDFARYQAIDRAPLVRPYRTHNVVGFPPPSSGGIHIAQMLGMLQTFDVREIFRNSQVQGYHLLAEVMKRAFADRAFWLGDSDFVDVPTGLLAQDYLLERMHSFSPTLASEGIEHGLPPGCSPSSFQAKAMPGTNEENKHTTHLTVADKSGNWVAMTCTINTSWGSKVMVPGTGVVLNNEMDDFSLAPGTPNAFGLVGSLANAVAPGKRPLSSMSPTIVLDSDRLPWITCGAAGGPRIITAALQILVRTIDLQQSIQAAIASSRIHHQWTPKELVAEKQLLGDDPFAIHEQTVEGLQSRGHNVRWGDALGIAQGIQRLGDRLEASHDPRAQGSSIH
jgi:gamma-glutamyltranspeptidase/glutathione hydrolase